MGYTPEENPCVIQPSDANFEDFSLCIPAFPFPL